MPCSEMNLFFPPPTKTHPSTQYSGCQRRRCPAAVQISHGVSEHILRYEPFAQYLTDRGFAVVGHDHLGHGSSVAPGAARLYFGPKGELEVGGG